MEQSSHNDPNVSGIDTMILAYGQLLQPADANRIYAFSEGTLVGNTLSKDQFHVRFKKLERDGFFWRTADNKYMVTPKGEALALETMSRKQRDKLRLLILNKERYNL
jgi:hypothetical protein